MDGHAHRTKHTHTGRRASLLPRCTTGNNSKQQEHDVINRAIDDALIVLEVGDTFFGGFRDIWVGQAQVNRMVFGRKVG